MCWIVRNTEEEEEEDRGVFRGGRTGTRPLNAAIIVVSTRSLKFKKHQNQQRPGLRPGPHWGSLQCSPRPLAGRRG